MPTTDARAVLDALLAELREGRAEARAEMEATRAELRAEIRAMRSEFAVSRGPLDAGVTARRDDLLVALAAAEKRATFSTAGAYRRAVAANGTLAAVMRALRVTSARSLGYRLRASRGVVVRGVQLEQVGKDREGALYSFRKIREIASRTTHLDAHDASLRPA